MTWYHATRGIVTLFESRKCIQTYGCGQTAAANSSVYITNGKPAIAPNISLSYFAHEIAIRSVPGSHTVYAVNRFFPRRIMPSLTNLLPHPTPNLHDDASIARATLPTHSSNTYIICSSAVFLPSQTSSTSIPTIVDAFTHTYRHAFHTTSPFACHNRRHLPWHTQLPKGKPL